MVPYVEMTKAEFTEFLSDRRQAIIGVDRKKGPPSLSTVWYRFENDQIYFTIQKESFKYKLLRRSPEVSVMVDGQYDDMRNVVVYGQASFLPEEDTKQCYFWIMERYFNDTNVADEFSTRSYLWGDWIIVAVTPDRVLARISSS